MNIKPENALPNIQPLPGAVCQQFVKRGSVLCGPYWYRFWREGGRLRKAYVRPENLAVARESCAKARAERAALTVDRRRLRELAANLRAVLSEYLT